MGFNLQSVGYVGLLSSAATGAVISAAAIAAAANYLNAAGSVAGATYYPATSYQITAEQLQSAYERYFDGLMRNGLWDKLVAIYPLSLGTPAGHKVNAKNPGTFDGVFFGGITHTSNGMKGNDTTGYVKTGLTLSTHVGPPAGGYSFHAYTNSNGAGGQADSVDMGVFGSAANALTLTTNNANSGSRASTRAAGVQVIAPTGSNATGIYSAVQTAAGLAILYFNGQEVARTVGTATTPVLLECYLLALNLQGSPYGYTSRAMQFFAIGREFSAADQATHAPLMATLQSSLKRQFT